jgi:cell division protein ZapA
MNEPFHTITVKLLDRDFKVKCPLDRVNDLQESAAYLDTKMKEVANSGKILSIDRIAAIAALNITQELRIEKKHKTQYIETINRRITTLQDKIENALDVKETVK